MSEGAGLGALFVSSFLAATLLPGGSEVVFLGVLISGTATFWPALAVATLGNTLGGMSSYVVGRWFPSKSVAGRPLEWVRRWGSPILLLSWVPLIGDVLCVAAGWMRFTVGWVLVFVAVGKFGRYLVLGELVK